MQINNFVYVMHPENGGVCLSPGEVPEWAVPLITNKAVIVQSEVPAPPKVEIVTPAPEKGEGAGEETGDGDKSKSEETDDGSGADEVPIPPKGGRGGSAEAWAKYAASKGFEVDGTAKASEIREALEAEGIPTE